MTEQDVFSHQVKMGNIMELLSVQLKPNHLIEVEEGLAVRSDEIVRRIDELISDNDLGSMEKIIAIFREMTAVGSPPLDVRVLASRIAKALDFADFPSSLEKV